MLTQARRWLMIVSLEREKQHGQWCLTQQARCRCYTLVCIVITSCLVVGLMRVKISRLLLNVS